MVHESLLSMDFAFPPRMGFDSTAWLAAAWALFMLLCPRLNHLPQASMWTDIHKHAHIHKYTHTKWYIPSNEAVSQKWLYQVDVHANNCIIVWSKSFNTAQPERFILDSTVDYSSLEWWYKCVNKGSIRGQRSHTGVNCPWNRCLDMKVGNVFFHIEIGRKSF